MKQGRRIQVDVGDKVRNLHTDEIFVVDQIFRMRKIGGGKYTKSKTWETGQLLDADDWELYLDGDETKARVKA
jgi:hypothetical protein